MIHRMMLNLQEKLQYRKFPIECVYGPDRTTFTGFTSNLYRFERDPDQSDVIGPPKGARGQQGQPLKAIRELAVRVTIYGQSPLGGAMPHDHDHETDQLVDGLIVALSEWTVQAYASSVPLTFTEARFVTNKGEREALYAEGWPGAVYLLRFRIPRAVDALNYVSGSQPGTARPQGSASGADNTINILRAGQSAETVP